LDVGGDQTGGEKGQGWLRVRAKGRAKAIGKTKRKSFPWGFGCQKEGVGEGLKVRQRRMANERCQALGKAGLGEGGKKKKGAREDV